MNASDSDNPVVRYANHSINDTGWGTLQWLLGATSHPAIGLTIGRVTFAPAQSNPVHFHPNCDEVLHVIEGTLEHSLPDGSTTVLQPGDSIVIRKSIPHSARNIGPQPALAVIIFNSSDRQTVLIEQERAQEGCGNESNA
jgi:quercetin dioxygenase-like cupin family protein